MLARLSHYTVEPDRIDEAIRGFEDAVQSLREIDGNEGGYLLADREQGKMITLTFWESQAALTDSEVRAASLRRRAVQGSEGTVEAVHSYDVALDFSALTHS